MRRIELIRVGWCDYRPWRAKSGSVAGSLAWSKGDQIWVRRGADRFLWGLQRIGHELEHALCPDFGNAEHHSAAHRCLRVYSPWRRWLHAERASPTLAAHLRTHGFLDVGE